MADSKKRKKSYYFQAKRQCGGRQMLDVDLRGFLITCNRKEKQAIREAYNLLNDYSCQLYGEESNVKTADEENIADAAEIDFSEAIQGQIEAVRGNSEETTARRFQAVDTKTTNCVFIKTTLERPDELVLKLLSDASATGAAKSRFILKIFPVLGTCRADTDKIEQLVETLTSSYFADRPLGTFAIVYKVRCNSLSRETILPTVGRAIYRACPTSKTDLTNPDYVFSIDVLNKYACVSILKDFYKLKKYNLQEVAKSSSKCTADAPAVEQDETIMSENVSNREDGALEKLGPTTNTFELSVADCTTAEVTETGVNLSSTDQVSNDKSDEVEQNSEN